MNLCLEVRNPLRTRSGGERVYRRAANAVTAPGGEVRELGDAPAALTPPDQTHADDLAVDLDQQWQPLRLGPVRGELRIPPGPAVELEQVVAEQPLEPVAIVELCVAQCHRHGSETTRVAIVVSDLI